MRVHGDKCLDAEASGTSPGTRVVIWDCHGGSNQRWNVNANGTVTSARSGSLTRVVPG
ncbi:RICIN domain-containing protein [Streptomyces chartreusis]|uniref:RICIN domain-containing protein n=1 Tax=Streptomyces chartreusis TaxID=1969 RepID=UPI0033B3998D